MGHRGDNSRGSLGNREGWKARSDLDLDVAWVGEDAFQGRQGLCQVQIASSPGWTWRERGGDGGLSPSG